MPVETTMAQRKTAQLVSSVPLSLTITLGVLRSNPRDSSRAPRGLRRAKYPPPWPDSRLSHHDAQDAEAPSVAQCVRHEVE